MKLNVLRKGILALALTTALISCTEDEVATVFEESLTAEDVSAIEEIDAAMDDISVDVEQAFVLVEGASALSTKAVLDKSETDKGGPEFFPECLTKTVVTEQNMKIVTLDFGEGCEIRGRFIAGIIMMTYEKDPDLQTKTITVTFDGYRVNKKLIEGSKTIVRTRENENGNPQSTSTFDIMVTWDNGDTASRVGEKVREMIAGSDTWIWSDNVYSTTGNWNTVRKNGTEITAQIVNPLIRNLECRFIISGSIDLTKNDRHGVLDFGEGECDNMATLTLDDGTVIEVTLPKRD
ncbi:hypothetical protein [Urechidicola vernalis]|uniref:Lipoprotein n=1 Tax=Urechidicola vernalis TaxID=3075600 RepID=A0ABU2Y867_9FLAO|nr:hypothetical protein [Urechidicola sp. P050]MDT0553243.1 hypothetical protein [Urechidicola sp. P050]